MRNVGVIVVLGVLSAFMLSSCVSVGGIVSESVGAAASQPAEQALEQRMSMWSDEMAFQMAYTQVFFLGGYGAGLDDFEEGEGATWSIVSTDGEEESSFIGERALLRRNDDGTSWWYLRFQSEEGDEQEYEYETRVDEDYTALEVYLRDPETGEIRHQVFDVDEQPQEASGEQDEWEDPDYDEEEVVFDEDWGEYREERVSVTVGAGTYEADKLVYDYTDEETGDSVEYRWWVTEEVPGQVVLYEWESLGDPGELQGELIEVREDYSAKFAEYE
ncbi:MAG: hypothetical protein ACQETQ_07595 [Spirochaetota bacterium]